MTQRTERIDALLREEIGAILAREVADPAIGFATVTDVQTAPDLSHAQVWVSLIGQPDERAESLAALRRAMPYVRHLLGSRVRLRRIPELHARLDETAERGTRVLRLLAELEAGHVPDEETIAADPLPTPVGRLAPESEDAAAPTDSKAAAGAGARPRSTGPRPRSGPSARTPGRRSRR